MAFETKNFFNSTIKQIYQQTGAILSLSTRSDKQLLINSLKLFEANFVYNWQKIHYPLLHGPTGSPYEKYTGMRSKPWAEYDALDSVYGGISGWTLTAEPWATEDSLPALWDETNKQPHSITGALYYLSQRIEDLTVENDELEIPQYDDREVKADIDCLEKNLETIYKDVYGCAYSLDCDGGKQNQFSLQTHLFQIFDQLVDGGPQLSIDSSCEDLYPAMSIYMPTSGLTYDVKIPNTEIDGVCGNNLQDDLNLIHSYIGLNNCETSPTYSDYGTLNYLTDGNSLEESLWDLDNAIGSFSATKTLFGAYQDGWLDANNSLPGIIQIKDNANKANANEGIKIVHPRTNMNWYNPSVMVGINNNLGTVFEDDLFEIADEAISGSDYVINTISNKFGSPDIDRWFKHTTVGEHEVGRKAQVALPNPAKYGDFIYPSFHIYRSIFNQMPTSGIPRTRASTQAYEGYTSYQINETAIWVATGLNRDGDSWTTVPEAGKPYDCNGDLVSENNLYYRKPGDGTIYKLNNCNQILTPTVVTGIFGNLTTSSSSVVVSSVRSDTGETVYHDVTDDALSIKLASTSGDSRVGVGIENPDGKLHVFSGEAGAVTAVSYSDDLIIEGNGGTGLSILTPNANSGNIVFGSASNADNVALRGYYYDGSPKLEIEIDGTTQFKISSTGIEVPGNLTVNGTTTTINSTTLQVDDKNIELGTVDTPTDTTANGGGITLKAASDKSITWDSATNAWTSNVGLHSNGPLSTDGAFTATGAISTQSTIKLGGEANDEGKIRYNATSNEFEGHDGTSWGSLGSGGGGGINNVVEDISPQLGGDLDIYSGSNHFGFKDSASSDVSPVYRFYGKDAAPGNANNPDRPAKLRLHGGGSGSNSIGINVDFNINSDYDIRLPPSAGSMGQVLKVTGTTGATVLSWADECCPESATSSDEGTVILAHPTTPVSSSSTGDEVVTITSLSAIPLTEFDDTGFSLAYSDLTGTPTIPTNNNQLTNGAGYVTTDTNYTYSIDATNDGSDFYIRLNGANGGSNSLLEIEAGTGITLSNTSANKLTISSSGGGSGTVTSITPAADNGSGTAITSSGTISIEGGTNVTTSVSGSTVTVNATAPARTFGSISVDVFTSGTAQGKNVHGEGLNVFNETEILISRSSSEAGDSKVQFNVDKGYSVGDVVHITNTTNEVEILFQAVQTDTFSNSPSLVEKFQGYHAATTVNIGGGNSVEECQFGSVGTSLDGYDLLKISGGSRVRMVCTAVNSGTATFTIFKIA